MLRAGAHAIGFNTGSPRGFQVAGKAKVSAMVENPSYARLDALESILFYAPMRAKQGSRPFEINFKIVKIFLAFGESQI